MKIAIPVFFSVLISAVIIYLLQPLNAGAVGFIMILCTGFVALVTYVIKKMMKNSFKRNIIWIIAIVVIIGILLYGILLLFNTGQNLSTESSEPIPARDYSFLNRPYRLGYGAYGYALINDAKYDTALYTKNQNFANAYFDLLSSVDSYKNINRINLMVTYWLLNENFSDNTDNFTYYDYSSRALNHYNYSKAIEILSSIKKLNSSGPVLVAWKRPFEIIKDSTAVNHYIMLNLTNFNAEDMHRAMLIWRDFMTDNVSTFEMAVINFKEQMRSLAQKYGGCISDKITKKK